MFVYGRATRGKNSRNVVIQSIDYLLSAIVVFVASSGTVDAALTLRLGAVFLKTTPC